MMFKEFQKNTTSAFDRAKLLALNRTSEIAGFTRTEIGEEEGEGGGLILPASSTAAADQLETLAEYCPQLTFQQRLVGFTVSFSVGYLMTFCSFRFFLHMVAGHPVPFALNYTAGHILQLLASTFLCGPQRQFKNMFDDKRRIASTVYLSCLACNLVIIFLTLPSSLKLILLWTGMLLQLGGSVWYTLSYIPYGRRAALQWIRRLLGWESSSSGSSSIAEYSRITLGGIFP